MLSELSRMKSTSSGQPAVKPNNKSESQSPTGHGRRGQKGAGALQLDQLRQCVVLGHLIDSVGIAGDVRQIVQEHDRTHGQRVHRRSSAQDGRVGERGLAAVLAVVVAGRRVTRFFAVVNDFHQPMTEPSFLSNIIHRPTRRNLRSWVSDDSLYSRSRSPQQAQGAQDRSSSAYYKTHHKTLSC